MDTRRHYTQSRWSWLAAAAYRLWLRGMRAAGLALPPDDAPAMIAPGPPSTQRPEPEPKGEPAHPTLLGLAQIAALAGVDVQAARNWRHRYEDFPAPIQGARDAGLWEREVIETWLDTKSFAETSVLSFINLKGGVGKTTTAIAVAEILAHEDRRHVLLIDLDPQTNATVTLISEEKWAEMDRAGRTVAQLFEDYLNPQYPGKFDIETAIAQKVSTINQGIDRLDLLPSSIRLIDIQERIPMIAASGHFTINPLDVLSDALKPVIGRYDYIIIDCPPSLGTVTKNGLRFSTGYVIPTIPDTLSTWGIYQIVDHVDRFARDVQRDIPPLGIVVTKVQTNNLHQRVIGDLKGRRLGRFGEAGRLEQPPVFESTIPQSVAVARGADVLAGFRTLRLKYGDAYASLHSLTQEIKAKCEKKSS